MSSCLVLFVQELSSDDEDSNSELPDVNVTQGNEEVCTSSCFDVDYNSYFWSLCTKMHIPRICLKTTGNDTEGGMYSLYTHLNHMRTIILFLLLSC